MMMVVMLVLFVASSVVDARVVTGRAQSSDCIIPMGAFFFGPSVPGVTANLDIVVEVPEGARNMWIVSEDLVSPFLDMSTCFDTIEAVTGTAESIYHTLYGIPEGVNAMNEFLAYSASPPFPAVVPAVRLVEDVGTFDELFEKYTTGGAFNLSSIPSCAVSDWSIINDG